MFARSLALGCLLFSAVPVQPTMAQEFGTMDVLKNKIEALEEKVAALQSEMNMLPASGPGPRGERGLQGERGPAGPPGPAVTVPFPINLVAAFDGKCPTGWKEYEGAQGRFVIGVGKGYLLNQTGGVREHILSSDELPSYRLSGTAQNSAHSHSIAVQYTKYHREQSGSPNPAGGPQTGRYSKRFPRDGVEFAVLESKHDHPVTVDSGGRNKGHNNMPPYIALYLCTPDMEG